MSLAEQTCEPCRGGIPPMTQEEAEEMLLKLTGDWGLNDAGHLQRSFSFSNFVDSLAFANAVGELAEEQGHHPDLLVRWGSCGVEIWTHKIGGLAVADFILAAKIERIYAS